MLKFTRSVVSGTRSVMKSMVAAVKAACTKTIGFVKKTASDTVEGVRQGLAEEEETEEADDYSLLV